MDKAGGARWTELSWKGGLSISRGKGLRPVMMIPKAEYFRCVLDAAQKYHLDSGNIIKCCKGEIKSCGKTKDGLKMYWRYYDKETETVIPPELVAENL